jgi:hypothetical protein
MVKARADSYVSVQKENFGKWDSSAIALVCVKQERIPIERDHGVSRAQRDQKAIVDSGFVRERHTGEIFVYTMLDCRCYVRMLWLFDYLTVNAFEVFLPRHLKASFVDHRLEAKRVHEIIHHWNTLAGRISLGKRSSACSSPKQDHVRTQITRAIKELLGCHDHRQRVS